MCKSLLEYVDRASSESFKNMTGTFTWECRYFNQSLSDGNCLIHSSMDILIWDLGNAFLGKSSKESLEGSNTSVTGGKHIIKHNLKSSYITLFVETQIIEFLVNPLDK